MSGMQELVKTVLGQIDIYFLMIRLLVPLVAKDVRHNTEAIFTFQQTAALKNKEHDLSCTLHPTSENNHSL